MAKYTLNDIIRLLKKNGEITYDYKMPQDWIDVGLVSPNSNKLVNSAKANTVYFTTSNAFGKPGFFLAWMDSKKLDNAPIENIVKIY